MPAGPVPRFLPFLLFAILAAAAAAVLFVRGAGAPLEDLDETRVLMETFVTVRVVAEDAPRGRAAIEAAFGEMERVARLLDWFDSTSALGRPFAPTDSLGIPIAPDIAHVLGAALAISEASGGAYDPTVRPLTAAWRFEGEPRVPSEGEIAAALARLARGSARVRGDRLVIRGDSVSFDLGGIAKGYAADRAIARLRESPGIRGALVACSGDIGAFGQSPRRAGWRVGLAHPRDASRIIARFRLGAGEAGGAVSTSGDYERVFFDAGKRFHHLLDPKTGYPAAGCASATVFAPTGIEADALATAAFVLGPDAGRRFLEGRPGCEGIWIVEAGGALSVVTTHGLAEPDRIEIEFDALESSAAWERALEGGEGAR